MMRVISRDVKREAIADRPLHKCDKLCKHKNKHRHPGLHSKVKLNLIEAALVYTKGKGNDLRVSTDGQFVSHTL